MSEASIIIGIHGLSNKPPEEDLRKGWRASILEGLARNCRVQLHDLPFELVYWRPWNYDEPIPADDNGEPYRPADGTGPLPTYEDGWRDEVVARALDVAARPLDWAKRHFGIGRLADSVLEHKLEDLALYYENQDKSRALREQLEQRLVAHSGKRIMLIAHSMGSIVAYDTLRKLGRRQPDAALHHLVTIGSPLGLPHVIDRIYQEKAALRTPSIVRRWTNFADRRDVVAFDVHLSDDYGANDAGVQVRDDLVVNGYEGTTGKANPHKSYGYLRAPEVSKVIRNFL